MISSVDESRDKDLKRMLEYTITDACDWTKHIASTTALASYTQSGEESCPTFLRKQCVAKMAKGDWLKTELVDTSRKIREFVHDQVLPDREYIEDIDRQTWIDHHFSTSNSLSC